MDLVQVAQRADDLDRAAAFYTRLLGVEPAGRFDPPGLLFFRLGTTRLLLERGAPSAVLYLGVPDAREAIARLEQEGVRIVSPAAPIFRHDDAALGPAGTDEWMGFIEDSEGNTVGLVSRHPTGPETATA